MRSSSKGWFCQNPNGWTRHWTSWWGPTSEIDLFSRITYLLWGCDGRHDGPQSPQLCLPRHYLNLGPIYDGPNPRPFWSHFHEVTLGKEEPRHLELALHLPWGSVGLVSTFRGVDFWAVSYLLTVIFSPAGSDCARLGARHGAGHYFLDQGCCRWLCGNCTHRTGSRTSARSAVPDWIQSHFLVQSLAYF